MGTMTEDHQQQNVRLDRIETKIDQITNSVSQMSIQTAVIHEKVNDLEVRRREQHERSNNFSRRVDDLHDCVHKVEQHAGKLEAQMSITTKILFVLSAAIVTGVGNLLFNLV